MQLAIPTTPLPQKDSRNRPVLWDYQEKMVRDIYHAIRGGSKRILAVAVMGAGKTVLSSHIMSDVVSRGKRVIFLIHLECLAEQTAKTLWRYGIAATILGGGRDYDPSAPVIVASLHTIKSRLKKQAFEQILGKNVGLFISDEAHVTGWDEGFNEIDEYYPDTPLIGLTATPWRLSKKQWLGQKFDSLVVGPQPPDIVKQGKAVPCRWFAVGGVLDLDTLTVSRGEYTDSSIAQQALRPEALKHTFNEWKRLAGDRPTMMVGTTVNQAQKTADYFNSRGVISEVIIGSTPADERKAIYQRVEQGKTQCIMSVGCLSAGFDLPIISCVLYIRATKSKALFHQTAGRGSRAYKGKTDFILIDFGDNKKHGNPMGVQDYSIAEPPPREPMEMSKECPQCESIVSLFAQVCPECGFIFSSDDGKPEKDIVLEKLSEQFDKQQRTQLKQIRAWRKHAFENDLNPSLPIEKYIKEYGSSPPVDWTLWACLGRKNASMKRRYAYLEWVQKHCKNERYRNGWVAYHLALEFGQDKTTIEQLPWWWSILGVPHNASKEEVVKAYQSAIKTAHTEEDFHSLNEALAGAREDLEF